MAEPQAKRKITLKIGGASSPGGTPTATTPGFVLPSATSPAPETPSSEAGTKIKLSLARKPLPSGAPDPPAVMPPPPVPTLQEPKPSVRTKTGRITKPTAKKRAKDEIHDDGQPDGPVLNGTSGREPKAKRIKVLKTPLLSRQPTLKLKTTGKLPYRPPGDGYDSEAEDGEVDPIIEEQFILRMPPGEHCDYIRRAIQERKIGLPRHLGGADLSMKWVDDEGRRCMVTVQGQNYAAVLLDLPTITEGMKTWDKKSLIKAADICQMLLVFDKVKNEEEVKHIPLPKLAQQGYRWPHGLTPPMHDCIHRRFRKRLSKLEIQNKEAEVERLLKADQEAISTKWEFVDDRQQAEAAREESQQYEEEELEEEEEEEEEEEVYAEADAEGEAEDYFGDGYAGEAEPEFEVDDALLEAEFEAQVSDAMAEPMDAATPTVGGLEVATPVTATATPAAQTDVSGAEEDGEDEEESEEDEDGEENGDIDDDDEDGGRHDEVTAVRNEIAHLKKQLTDLEGQLARSVQPIMKRRIEQNIKNLKAELELKKSSIGENDDD